MSLTAYYSLICQNSLSVMAVGAIAAISGLFLIQRITKPICVLTKAAQKLNRDNFALQSLAKISRSQNDIGQLAHVFLQIAEEVKVAREQRLKQQVKLKEVFLKELSNSDIDWLTAMGCRAQIAAGTVLVQQGKAVETLHIVIDGILTVTVSQDKTSDWEIARLGSGEVVGENLFIGAYPIPTTIKAVEKSLLFSINRQQLTAKLQQDVSFASRFYRAIAILLLDRFEHLLKTFYHRQNLKIPPLQDVLLIFGELSDSDIDWMIAHSHVEEIIAGTVLIQASRPVENLYVLLQGSISISLREDRGSSLARVFTENENHSNELPEYKIAQITRGEIIGEMGFFNAHLPSYTFKASENAQVLVIKRQQLLIKLQQNPAMGSRFYRMVAMLLSARLQGLISHMEYGTSADQSEHRLSRDFENEDEIDSTVMNNSTIGGARFNWMLRRLKVLS